MSFKLLGFLLTALLISVSTYVIYVRKNSICPVEVDLRPEGTLKLAEDLMLAEMLFLDDEHFLVTFYGSKEKSSPIHIYKKTDSGWSFFGHPKGNPTTQHPRQIIKDDLDGDNVAEVIISDHGLDDEPFPGHHVIILRKKNTDWVFDEVSLSLGTDFTFNTAVLDLPDEKKAFFKVNTFSRNPFFFEIQQDSWKNITSSLPHEITSEEICFMTGLKLDFDQDGKTELFLGGCDRDQEKEVQTHDRIMTQENGKWKILPRDIFPPRQKSSMWGTVFVKEFDYNGDKYPDILTATHDAGFHHWKTLIYVNHSSPGKIKFKEVILPLEQEEMTEGYIHALQDFQVEGYKSGILAQVRSVLRDPIKKDPINYSRLLLQHSGGRFFEATACLPSEIHSQAWIAGRIPGDPQRLLLLSYSGKIVGLKLKQKSLLRRMGLLD